MIRTHYVRVEGLHINISDGAAGKRPHLGFVFESSSDLQKEVNPSQTLRNMRQSMLCIHHKLEVVIAENFVPLLAN